MLMALYRLRSKLLFKFFLKARQLVLKFWDPVVTIQIKKRKIKGHLSSTFPLTFRTFPEYDTALIRVCRFISPKLNQPLRIIDIGANIGDTFTMLDQEISAEFLCVEGNPDFFSLLVKNTRHSNNIIPIQAYLGDQTQENEVTFQQQQHGTCYLGKANTKIISPRKHIQIVTLDQVLAQYPLFQNSQILKIDTDGFDCKIMRGATNFIAKFAPVIYFEFFPAYLLPQKEDPLTIFAFLCSLGYPQAIFYDNTGFPIIELPTDEKKQIDSLVNYSLISDKIFFDVLLFPGNSGEGFFKQEMTAFPMKHSLVQGMSYAHWLTSKNLR